MKSLFRRVCGVAAALALASTSAQPRADERVTLPGTSYEIVLEPKTGHAPTPPSPALIEAIGAWLSFSFELPATSQRPSLRFATPEDMAALRHRGVASDHRTTIGATVLSEAADILALYDDEERAIYLRDDWSGDTPAALSIVVHEMVHHVQNLAGLRFECYEAREKQAFAAQEQWLALFGKDLDTEFGLDPLTLLVRTNCPF
jgi:hypothetical protein